MRFDFRTLSRAISTLVVLCVLFVGMGLDVSAHDRGRNRGRNPARHRAHELGRHPGRRGPSHAACSAACR